jgi:hypothetical protein
LVNGWLKPSIAKTEVTDGILFCHFCYENYSITTKMAGPIPSPKADKRKFNLKTAVEMDYIWCNML